MNHVLKVIAGDKEKQMRSYFDPAFPVARQLMDEMSRFIKVSLTIHQPG
jgi:hypothetical protein